MLEVEFGRLYNSGPILRSSTRHGDIALGKAAGWGLFRAEWRGELGRSKPMPSPFPGMDPYLESEALWPLFHHQLVLCLYQILLPGLVDRYRARVSQRIYATEQALFTSVVREDHHEDYIEIRQRNDGRLVTLLDVVSPPNKTTRSGREAYLAKRRE